MGGVEPPSCGADQERLQVYRREVVVGTRWQRRKRRFRIRKNVPSTVPARWKASSGWRRKIRMLRSSIIRFPRSATYAARAKLSLFSAVISFARSEDERPHLQLKVRTPQSNPVHPHCKGILKIRLFCRAVNQGRGYVPEGGLCPVSRQGMPGVISMEFLVRCGNQGKRTIKSRGFSSDNRKQKRY